MTGGAAGEQPTGEDYWARLIRVEPDFVQKGSMNLIVRGREFAQAPELDSLQYVFQPDTAKIDMREQRRQITLRFESNVVDGDYHMGRVLLHIERGDIRS